MTTKGETMKMFKVCDKIVVAESLILQDITISAVDIEKVQKLSINESCYISFGLTKNGKIVRIQ